MRSSILLPGFPDEPTDTTFQQTEMSGIPVDSVWHWRDVVALGNDVHRFGTDALNLCAQVAVDTQLEHSATIRVAGQLCVDNFVRTSRRSFWVYSLCRGSRHGRTRSRQPAAGRISRSRIGTHSLYVQFPSFPQVLLSLSRQFQ